MNYADIKYPDIQDGTGIRIAIYVSGCHFHCPECHNKMAWNPKYGKEFTDETIDRVLELCKAEHIVGLSILGGEPMHPDNIEGTTKLAKKFKEEFPNKTIWSWTGFTFEGIKDKEVFNYIDVLVDGQFRKELFDPRLHFKGSSNQRVIDIKKSLKKDEIVLYEEEEY